MTLIFGCLVLFKKEASVDAELVSRRVSQKKDGIRFWL